jgi:hypothetical protein
MNSVHIAAAFPAQNLNTFKANTAGNNGTLIAVILDESGSMGSCRDATISGFNEFVQGQRAATGAGEAYLSLIKFDAPQIKTVYENVNVQEVAPLSHATYTPNGGTNLMDAIGQTLSRINQLLSVHAEADRPGVLVVIITDGAENASRVYSGEQIKSMVKTAEASDWTFTFLGANVDAFHMGSTFGMNASNTINYATTSMAATMGVLNEAAVKVRSAKMAGVHTQALYASNTMYSDSDRTKTMGG